MRRPPKITGPIVFTDIEGVLVPSRDRHPDMRSVEQLNRIILATEASVVLTSIRRTDRAAAQTLLGGWGVTGTVVGITPSVDAAWDADDLSAAAMVQEMTAGRGLEIQAWLDENPGVESYVILDGGRDMGGLLDRLVQTNTDRGLTVADADRAILMLLNDMVRPGITATVERGPKGGFWVVCDDAGQELARARIDYPGAIRRAFRKAETDG